MNKFKSFLGENIVLLDGGMGTLLQARGLAVGEYPERWNLSNPDVIVDIQADYFDAGSNVVCTNTFGANALKFADDELEAIIAAAIKNAKKRPRGENIVVCLSGRGDKDMNSVMNYLKGKKND